MIEAIKEGDAFAFEQAYRETCEKVYAYFLKKTDSREDAKDLLQTTYLKLWKYRDSLSNDYLLDQHLFHIARTVFIDYLRTRNKNVQLEKSMASNAETMAPYVYPAREYELNARLQTSLSAMPEIRKRVFELNRLQGYSYREVAGILSITVKSVDNNLSKALRQLRKVFVALIAIVIGFL